MSLEENARRELDQRDTRTRDTLRGEFNAQMKSFRGEMRVMFVIFLGANQAVAHLKVGIEVAGVAGAFVGAMWAVPRFLNR